EQLSRRIVAALQLTLTSGEHQALAERLFKRPEAYEFYGKARFEIGRYSRAAYDRAVGNLLQAEPLEARNALLISTRGLVYCMYRINGIECESDPMRLAQECLIEAA